MKTQSRSTRRNVSPTGLRVIIVEDSFLLARGLAGVMERAGFVVAGLAGNQKAALELIEAREFDVAVLDVMLGSQAVTEVALRLHADNRPIVFLSGYNDLEMLPPELRAVPRLTKPVEPALLVRTIRDVVGAGR